jgi:predicted transcriptional regulator
MKIDTSSVSLPVFEALASEVRLRIIGFLAEKPMNIKELAEALQLSSAIMTMHINKLEKGGIVTSKLECRNGGNYKYCSLAVEHIEILLPARQSEESKRTYHEMSIPVGHYTDFEVHPTCGLATRTSVIGQFDDPRFFLEPERMNAQILWLGKGYVEYRLPNYLLLSQQLQEIEISMELGSEAPGINENWPSDISFYLNGIHLGYWTSPGDYGLTRGKYTPDWWGATTNQYGLLKILRINASGTYVDGQKISEITLADLEMERNQWTFRLAVPDEAKHVGGLTIYGKGFGNYDQDIVFRVFYQH